MLPATRTTASPLDAESERLFALMDADGDGQLTEAEGRTVADARQCNASTFWKLLLKCDHHADGDGTISRSEFSEALKGRVLQAFFPRHAEKDFGAVVAAAIQALAARGGSAKRSRHLRLSNTRMRSASPRRRRRRWPRRSRFNWTRMTRWRDNGGGDLESALQVDPEHGDSPVALIDARYIVELWKRGGKILRRQDLPKEAFIGLETVKRLPRGGQYGDCLRVIAVSHPWQQPDHPDPKEVNLTLLAKVLERFIKDGTLGMESTTYACFFDFMSCFTERSGRQADGQGDGAIRQGPLKYDGLVRSSLRR